VCTNITIRTDVDGSAKGPDGWFKIDAAYVSFDHPFHAAHEHTLNIDLINEAGRSPSRVAIELSPDAARALARNIDAALAQGELEVGTAPEAKAPSAGGTR
jgi:hypothetical protein